MFKQETPLSKFLFVMADLLGLNLLFLACSIPIVTIGASLSAMYAVLFRRERDEGEVAVIRTFFHAFRQNFWKATVLELIALALLIVTGGDFWYAANLEGLFGSVYTVVGTIMALLLMTVLILAFAQQSVYQNSIAGYLKNSFVLAACAPWQLIVAIAAWVVPWLLAIVFFDEMIQIGVIYVLWGFSFPAWVTAKLIFPVFEKTSQSLS